MADAAMPAHGPSPWKYKSTFDPGHPQAEAGLDTARQGAGEAVVPAARRPRVLLPIQWAAGVRQHERSSTTEEVS